MTYSRAGSFERWRSARSPSGAVFALVVVISMLPCAARAQHEHPPAAEHDTTSMMRGPLGISLVRMGSGTAWIPDSSPMHAAHRTWGSWNVMLHGAVFPQFDHQGSRRGDDQAGIINWGMLMGTRQVGTGLLHLHGMMSLEPLTIGNRGYPLLLQTGESDEGAPLHDRQHPHDAFMELAALFQQPVARDLAVELYAGVAGEPALGPVAYMHRPSGAEDPTAPLGHHWQDATHISFGVVTAGLYSRRAKLEGSIFNGREPDEQRWNIELRRLNAYAGRLTLVPTGRLVLAGWYGWLPDPELLHPGESVHRYGVSALYGGRGIAGGAWASTLMWAANANEEGADNSALAESSLEIGAKDVVFGRAEYVRKSAGDLALEGIDPERRFDIGALVLGYVREIAAFRGGTIGLGGRGSVNFVPAAVGEFYGTRTPSGVSVYLRVRPGSVAMPATMEHEM